MGYRKNFALRDHFHKITIEILLNGSGNVSFLIWPVLMTYCYLFLDNAGLYIKHIKIDPSVFKLFLYFTVAEFSNHPFK